MHKLSLATFLLLFCSPVLTANEKGALSAVVQNATYVLVTTPWGNLFDPRVNPDDRKAAADVQDAIEKWGRYKLVYNLKEAELILVVRTGRAVEVHGGVGVQVGSTTGPRGSAKSVGAETGDPQDTLEVYMASQGISGVPLWRSRAASGLKPPEMLLVQEFRSKVEASGKKKP